MADSFGLKIGIEGEKEFKSALAEINQSFKVLGSEMKLVDSQFDQNDTSMESLAARSQVLGSQINTVYKPKPSETDCSCTEHSIPEDFELFYAETT